MRFVRPRNCEVLRSDMQIYASLPLFERLCDAIADGEFADMGFGKAAARQSLIEAITAAL
ncbi:MAG TPA: hypothetical protein VIM56_04640 [Rhizomicrobium sp.]